MTHSLFADAPEGIADSIAVIVTQLRTMANNLFDEIKGLEASSRAAVVERMGPEYLLVLKSWARSQTSSIKKMPAYVGRFEDARRKAQRIT
jgi:hypothetical protein